MNKLLFWAALAVVLVSAPALAQEAPVQTTPQGVRVDFRDADIRLVVSALAEAGGLNVSFGELPARRVTMRLTQPVPPQNILPLLRSVVQSNGLILRDEGGFLRVEQPGGAGSPGGSSSGVQEEAAGGGTRLFVYRLRHVRATRLAATLQSLYGGSGRGRGTPSRARTLSDELRQGRIPSTREDGTVPERQPVLEEPLPGLPGDVSGEIQIVADESTNSLLVRADPGDWSVIRQAIELLDLRPLQVLIEVLVAEVRRNKDLEVSVTARGSNSNDVRPLAGLLGGLPSDSAGGGRGELVVRALSLGGIDLDVALTALASRGRVRILSRPVLMAQNNLEAKILVGEQRPFFQVVRTLPTGDAVRDQVVQYRDVGTSLTITPTINPDGYVNLQLTQEVSSVAGAGLLGAPVIGTREASTHLFARDGQTVVIGGLVEWQRERTRSGIPFLKDIPLLGALFGSTRRSDANSEIFLFLTPHIVASDADMDRVRREVGERTDTSPERAGQEWTLVPPATPAPRTPSPGQP